MGDLVLTVFDTDDAHRAATLRALGQHLLDSHRWATDGEWRQLYVSLCESSGTMCGGILAYTHGTWLEIQFVWVDEPLRHQGHAKRMLDAAELEARRRSCRRAYLDTASSSAVGFFLAQGYRVCGELEEYREGQSRYWLHKHLDSQEAEQFVAPDCGGIL
jgi:ribosomal protein S18 acetylase RimI-like enzyme